MKETLLTSEYCESNKADLLLTPDLNLRDSDDLTPLGVALGTGQITVAKHLLEAGADINTTNMQGYSLLHLAIQVKNAEVATFLINNGAETNLRHDTYWVLVSDSILYCNVD